MAELETMRTVVTDVDNVTAEDHNNQGTNITNINTELIETTKRAQLALLMAIANHH